MVSPGQYLERPTLIPLPGGLVLEGVAHRGDRVPGLLVLPPPPDHGSGMDHVVAAEIAYAASRRGHSTLRFNYRGVGGSQGERSSKPSTWLEDAAAALELAVDNARGAGAAVASIGGSDAVAFELARKFGVAGLVLVSPAVVGPGDFEREPAKAWPLGIVLSELDSGDELSRWSAALGRLDIQLTVVPGATRSYLRNLPMVGTAVTALLDRTSSFPATP